MIKKQNLTKCNYLGLISLLDSSGNTVKNMYFLFYRADRVDKICMAAPCFSMDPSIPMCTEMSYGFTSLASKMWRLNLMTSIQSSNFFPRFK